eukprot:12067636-Prorocentrum_lima.AAC.1
MPRGHVRPQTLVVLFRRDFHLRHPLYRTRLLNDMKHRRTHHIKRLRGEPRGPHAERPECLAHKASLSHSATTPQPRPLRGARCRRLASTLGCRAALRR